MRGDSSSPKRKIDLLEGNDPQEEIKRLREENNKLKNENNTLKSENIKLKECSNKDGKVENAILSEEQEEIAKLVLAKKNVNVISKAGSGKTRTSLEIAKRFYKENNNEKTLILTYNKRLKVETRNKIKEMNTEGFVEAHSYHAAAFKFFCGGKIKNSQSISKDDDDDDDEPLESPDNGLIIKASNSPKRLNYEFGLIIVDEIQDMKEIYMKFLRHLIKNNNKKKPVMLVLGYPFQQIYSYSGSNNDYLLNPTKHFGELCLSKEFIRMRMSICWRISQNMAHVINTKFNPNNLKMAYPDWWITNGEIIKEMWGDGIKGHPNNLETEVMLFIWRTKKIILIKKLSPMYNK
eukprot:TRINITY_DN507_c0_g1_i1.p1 TRINITY_DN507_c0_g1~~TRINITY_DN507_c0_g1_i1.p1  ORF type:complete len:396 (+),score=91.17 TRINITY_DN507_c0_g1_i1:143-1189(+)